MKIPFDIVTLAIPRGTTRRCILSLLDHWRDIDKYRTRWLVHLDQYERLKSHFEQELEDIQKTAKLFDEHIIITDGINVGFGHAVRKMMRLVDHTCLWSEDDWLYEKDFWMSDITNQTTDTFSMVTPETACGALHPQVWKPDLIKEVVGQVTGTDDDIRGMDEDSFVKICRKLRRTNLATDENVPYCRHIGLDVMDELGFEHGWNGQKIRGRRSRSHYDKKTQTWVKQ